MTTAFNIFVDFVFSRVQKNQDRQKSHDTCFFLPDLDSVNLSGENTRTSKKTACGLFVTSNVISLEINSHYTACKSKGKTIPLQAWTGPEGSRRLRRPDFKTVGTCRW